nr:MAG TPA: hypothetical protein [Caudoviricetes sp.]
MPRISSLANVPLSVLIATFVQQFEHSVYGLPVTAWCKIHRPYTTSATSAAGISEMDCKFFALHPSCISFISAASRLMYSSGMVGLQFSFVFLHELLRKVQADCSIVKFGVPDSRFNASFRPAICAMMLCEVTSVRETHCIAVVQALYRAFDSKIDAKMVQRAYFSVFYWKICVLDVISHHLPSGSTQLRFPSLPQRDLRR